MNTLAARIMANGVLEERGSFAPFWNHEPGVFRFVETGAVDVFAVPRAGDTPAGARRHVYRVAAGGILPGIDPHSFDAAQGFLAVCAAGTRLWRGSAAGFNALAADDAGTGAGDGAGADAMIELADVWIGNVTRGLPRGLPPKDFEILALDAASTAGAQQMLSPAARLVWVTLLEGRASFMGDAAAAVSASGTAVPLPVRNDVWLKVIEPVRAEAADPRDLAARGLLWDSLAAYHHLALTYFVSAARASDAAEARRLEQQYQRSQSVMADALARVVRVVTGGGVAAPVFESDPLLAALAPLGRYQGMQFRVPRAGLGGPGGPGGAGGPGGIDDSGNADPAATAGVLPEELVHQAAEASQVQVRRVALKGAWWRTDSGPLLVSHRETRQWLALIPVRGSSYALHDAASGAVRRVDEAVAAELSDFAFCFYRPLPASRLDALALLRFGFAGQGRDVAAVVLLSAVMGVLGMLVPFVTGKLIDTFIPSAERDSVWMVTAALLAAAGAATLFGIARAIAVLRVEGKMDAALQAALWDRLLKLPVPFFRDYSAGDLALRLNGINTMRHALAGGTIGTLLSSVFSSVNFLLLFYYSAKLALAALGITLVVMLTVAACAGVRLYYERQMAPVAGRLSGMVFQYLSAITKLRVASAETRAFANWAREFTWLRRLSFKAAQAGTVQETFFSVSGLAATAVIFALTGMLLAQYAALGGVAGAAGGAGAAAGAAGPPLSTGDFAAFIAAFGGFLAGMAALAATCINLLNLVPVYQRLKPVLDTLPEVDESKRHPGQLAGGIEVVKAGFHYRDGPAILKNVSFSIRPGGFIALVGASGSGKSTLLRLLLGFEKPTAGSIYYDNQDLADLDVHAIRRQIGVVLQGGQLMSGDIFSNIVGASQLGIDDAWEAARLCGLEEDIQNMPMGMHTVISEGASTLSGGQRQRILIARAVVHKPRIIFFDEATSALDNRTQAIVSSSLNALKATRVVIAHRLSTIVQADRIIVLKDGEVAQNGSYEKLVNAPGPFAELVKRQMA